VGVLWENGEAIDRAKNGSNQTVEEAGSSSLKSTSHSFKPEIELPVLIRRFIHATGRKSIADNLKMLPACWRAYGHELPRRLADEACMLTPHVHDHPQIRLQVASRNRAECIGSKNVRVVELSAQNAAKDGMH
jgi:hypothetical protein